VSSLTPSTSHPPEMCKCAPTSLLPATLPLIPHLTDDSLFEPDARFVD
jgi:hypothetical protein